MDGLLLRGGGGGGSAGGHSFKRLLFLSNFQLFPLGFIGLCHMFQLAKFKLFENVQIPQVIPANLQNTPSTLAVIWSTLWVIST